jgi:hypothetical protein
VRRCSCGGEITSGGECSRCRAKRLAQESALAQAASSRVTPVGAPGPDDAQPRFHYDFGRLRIRDEGRAAPPGEQFATARFIGELQDVPTLNGEDAGTVTDGGDAEPLQAGGGGGGCTNICDRAYASSSLNFGGGGVICDGSTKCACAFDVAPLTRGQCPGFDAIVLAHERGHLTDVDCNASGGLHRPPFRDPSAANASECTHRRASITQMDAIIPGAAGTCKTGMQSIRAQLDTWVRANCGSP